MHYDLTDSRVKGLAKALRSRLPKDPGQRQMLDSLAESLGYQSYGALKTAMAADAHTPAELPDLIARLDRTPVACGHTGSWIWRQFTGVEMIAEIDRVLGIETRAITLDSDPGDSAEAFRERLEQALDTDGPLPPLIDWTPTPPKGEGWILAGQFENENPDHVALFVRAPEAPAEGSARTAVSWDMLCGAVTSLRGILDSLHEGRAEPEKLLARADAIAREAGFARIQEAVAAGPLTDTPDEVYVVTLKTDDEPLVWTATDENLAWDSARDYVRETMGRDLDDLNPDAVDVRCAGLLARDSGDVAPIALDLHDGAGNHVETIEAPATAAIPRVIDFLAAMNREGLPASVRLADAAGQTAEDAEAPYGTIDRPWTGWVRFQGRMLYQTRFTLNDWRFIDAGPEEAAPDPLKVRGTYADTGVRFEIETPAGEIRELMLENSGGVPKVNAWSRLDGDNDLALLIEDAGTRVVGGSGTRTVRYTEGGQITGAAEPEFL